MLVTGIEEYNKRQVKICLDGELAFVLYKGELSEYQIEEGCELPAESYRILTQEVLVKRVRLRAMNLLTKRSYSEEGLRRKLREGEYPDWLIDNALEYVKSFGYINDETYAMDYIASMSGKYSQRMMREKLRQKGIGDDLIEKCLAAQQEELENEQQSLLQTLIDKKCRGQLPQEPSERAKLMRYLAGKGFSGSEIRHALSDYDDA